MCVCVFFTICTYTLTQEFRKMAKQIGAVGLSERRDEAMLVQFPWHAETYLFHSPQPKNVVVLVTVFHRSIWVWVILTSCRSFRTRMFMMPRPSKTVSGAFGYFFERMKPKKSPFLPDVPIPPRSSQPGGITLSRFVALDSTCFCQAWRCFWM